MRFVETHSWSGECMCCGESNKRIFCIEQNFMDSPVKFLMCADCATEEQEIEHYEQQQRAP